MADSTDRQAHSGLHQLVVVANRLPAQRVDTEWLACPTGFGRAVIPLLARGDGAWVGWAGEFGAAPEPVTFERVRLAPVGVSRQEHERFYEGFSIETLWPLYHDAIGPSAFHDEWWKAYVTVNRRYAERAAALVAEGGLVWVHDFHLQLVPGFLRELRPDVRIGFFLQLPFPPLELFMRLPWRDEIVRALLAADVVGFQRKMGAENFASVARRLLGAEGEPPLVRCHDHQARVSAYPMSIDVAAFERIASRPEIRRRAAELRQRLGSPGRVIVGADRLDGSTGIDVCLEAFRDLLAQRATMTSDTPGYPGPDTVMVQVALPGEEAVGISAAHRDRVPQLVGEINGAYATLGRPAVHYLRRRLPTDALVVLYRAADVMMVTPRREGMNLVAKEFAASRVDDDGVLLLSEFAGAADELTDAVVVNAHDRSGMVAALAEAIVLDPGEAKRRMLAIRHVVRSNDIDRWASGFLNDLASARGA